jgi:hypothetical protein
MKPIVLALRVLCACLLVLLTACDLFWPPPSEKVSRSDIKTDSLKTHPDLEWILQILNYESERGSQWGTGLPYWGNLKRKPATIDEAVQYFIKDYLPRVAEYPRGIRERLGDYYYNTGRKPEDLLLYTAGLISLEQINSKENLRSIWKRNSNALKQFYSDSVFVNRLDSCKDLVYRATKVADGKPNPAYLKTWKPRTYMWGIYSPTSK